MLLQRLTSQPDAPRDTLLSGDVRQLELAPDRSSPSSARRFVLSACRGWELPEELVESAVLAVSELVTNAVIHAATPALLMMEYDGHALTLAVADGEARLPQLNEPAEDDEHGRGVALVDRLGATWGTQRTVLGKTVWVSFPVEGHPTV